jgi:hypothetical protein
VRLITGMLPHAERNAEDTAHLSLVRSEQASSPAANAEVQVKSIKKAPRAGATVVLRCMLLSPLKEISRQCIGNGVNHVKRNVKLLAALSTT